MCRNSAIEQVIRSRAYWYERAGALARADFSTKAWELVFTRWEYEGTYNEKLSKLKMDFK